MENRDTILATFLSHGELLQYLDHPYILTNPESHQLVYHLVKSQNYI